MLGTPLEPASCAYSFPLLIRHLLHTPLAHAPDQEIVYSTYRRHTYREFRQRVGRLASTLAGLGIHQGSTVAVMDWDSHRYLESYFAVPMMGAVLHTVNIRLSPEQMLYTINHAEDDVILVHQDFVPVLERIHSRIEHKVDLILLEDGGNKTESSLKFAGEYEDLLSRSDEGYGFGDFDENTRATTFYTTGTTGNPKGVYYSHRQLVLHTLGFLLSLGWNSVAGRFHRGDVYMPLTPMFHVHGWGIPYGATLMGVKQVYPGRYEAGPILDLIDREKVTFSHCVPTILHMILSSTRAREVDLSRWKLIIGGSALSHGLAKRAQELGIDVTSAYGMSETCPLILTSQLDGDFQSLGPNERIDMRCKTGRSGPLVDVRVVDENFKDVPADEKTTGEVVVRAPWLTQSYFKDPERSEELWRDGYLHTGDIGHIGPGGYVQVTDRLKDIIKSGGEWISSLELETIISHHEAVGEVAAIGMRDEKWGERPLVLIVPKKDYTGKLSEELIKQHVLGFAERGIISKWAVPDKIQFVESIEKTSVGKIDKKLLRQKYAG
ncbi:MAG: fatty acid--CoA ligase [Acidobacteriota bacterium]